MRTYTITTVHPTGYMDGPHTITVKDSSGKPDGVVYCSAPGLGCSRDYATRLPWEPKLSQRDGDLKAIKMFLAEHAMTIKDNTMDFDTSKGVMYEGCLYKLIHEQETAVTIFDGKTVRNVKKSDVHPLPTECIVCNKSPVNYGFSETTGNLGFFCGEHISVPINH